MPFPNSPFGADFNGEILWKCNDDDGTTVNEIQKEEILKWLCTSPGITTWRVNTLKEDTDVKKHLQNILGRNIQVETHPTFTEVLLIKHPVSERTLETYRNEIIVDTICGAAILRGAHVYAPGVMAMMSGVQINDSVSVYADIAKLKCKKGFQKHYEGPKIYLGNGIVKMDRNALFRSEVPTGLAIEMIETISHCPSFGDNLVPEVLLQNLPSIVCVHVLNPQPDEIILDMCASPGNKTTHIAALMANKGKLVAIDKTAPKVAQLRKRCSEFNANVEIIQGDSTKLVGNSTFPGGYFDRILLDAPCSALGKRPQFLISTNEKILKSYIPLQKRLFENAVALLKKGGILVYSTCTITLGENEGIVAWALGNFPIKLVEASPLVSGPGLGGTNLTTTQLTKLQRFGPNQQIDSVGFFISKFIKTQ